jgi:transposase
MFTRSINVASSTSVFSSPAAHISRYSSEDKIRIVLSGLRGENSIAELCRQEGIARSQYYSWSKEFMEAGRKRFAIGLLT